jgi:hypothetical protein
LAPLSLDISFSRNLFLTRLGLDIIFSSDPFLYFPPPPLFGASCRPNKLFPSLLRF